MLNFLNYKKIYGGLKKQKNGLELRDPLIRVI